MQGLLRYGRGYPMALPHGASLIYPLRLPRRRVRGMCMRLAQVPAHASPAGCAWLHGRTSSTVNSPMEVVHLAVGLPDMVAKVARATRAVEGTMRAVGLNARAAAAEKIISVSASVIVGRRRGGNHGTFCCRHPERW